MIKKICVIVHSRANYGSIRSVLKNIKKSKKLTLQLVVGGSALLDKFGSITKFIKKDGFKINKMINFIIEGNSTEIMAKSTGLAIMETSDAFGVLKPDYVLTVGDRYETIATAISAAYMNIPLIHTMGGEISGTIDESVRHAVTKFANVHFAATKAAKKNIIKMGEVKKNVFNVGCPRIDEVKNILSKKINNNDINNILNNNGVGDKIDVSKPYIIIMFHPVTSEYGNGETQIINILKAITKFNIQKIFFWPNADAGYEDIAKGIRKWRERNLNLNTRFIKNLEQKYFYHLLNKSLCILGNSSSGLREGCYIGVKNISIGSRQNGREIGNNTIMIPNNYKKIYMSLKKVLKLNNRKKKDYRYGNGNAGKKIVKIIEKINVSHQKKLDY
jgi:UDP-hydrolysing UDP-N-acetyl-D-glucosamine 2-epimerase